MALRTSNEPNAGLSDLFQKFTCDFCQDDIPGLRIKCAECVDFDLCLECFASGAQTGKHKSWHKYMFMNGGGFPVFPESTFKSRPLWTAKEELKLLDAIERFGFGNWKDIGNFIETKTPEQARDEYIRQFVNGTLGKLTWKEELRGYAVDHTSECRDKGPLSPTSTSKLPPLEMKSEEALLLGYMPKRDDFEDFDRENENLVAQIAEKSAEDDDLDVLLKLAQCDIYERRLREQVRRKRVVRDFQLVSKFYIANPIVEIGSGAKKSSQEINNQIKLTEKKDDPETEIRKACQGFIQFMTAKEYFQFVNNICGHKELKVRIRELQRYRENGLTKASQLGTFEKDRLKRNLRNKRIAKLKSTTVPTGTKLLPKYGEYSLKSILDPFYDKKPEKTSIIPRNKKSKNTRWSRKKAKTGRRRLLQNPSCIVIKKTLTPDFGD